MASSQFERPRPLVVLPDKIPAELKTRRCWVLWRYSWDGSKWTKPPHRTDGSHASTTDSSTWATFEAASSAYESDDFDGIGIVLTQENDLAGVDIDHVRDPESGEIDAWALDVVHRLDSYTEVSPSGTGLRILVNAPNAPFGGKKSTHIEMYSTGRYLTITGQHVNGRPLAIEERDPEYLAERERWFPERTKAAAASRPSPSLSDASVLEWAFQAKNGPKVRALLAGDDSFHAGDTSAADLAFVSTFAFWTQDPAQLDRLFRGSGRMRPKWDERHAADGRTYGEMTIETALASLGERYDSRAIPGSLRAEAPESGGRLRPGGSFILDAPTTIPALWGEDDDVLHAAGEALLIVGPDGVGKTTLAQRYVLALLGLSSGLLGLPVVPVTGKVIYLAMDRPQQAARSFRRMVGEWDRAVLNERLVVWEGPVPVDVVADPKSLLRFIRGIDDHIAVVIVDSLKDIVLGLSEDRSGSAWNMARQDVLAAGIEVVELHHQRKEQRGANAGKPNKLADVYGSRWITGGAGSVVLLWGDAGDPIVELTHLKQPATTIGPFRVLHEQVTGSMSRYEAVDLLLLLRAAPHGLAVTDAARAVYETNAPTRNEVEKARRKLKALVKRGLAVERQGDATRASGTPPTKFWPATPSHAATAPPGGANVADAKGTLNSQSRPSHAPPSDVRVRYQSHQSREDDGQIQQSSHGPSHASHQPSQSRIAPSLEGQRETPVEPTAFPSCGHAFPPEVRACPSCWATLSPIPPAHMTEP